MTDVKTLLQSHKLKATTERLELYKVLLKARKPLSLKELKSKVKSADMTTLYRSLEAFHIAGLVSRERLHGAEHYFELQKDHHHHIVCRKCKKVSGVSVCLPKEVFADIKRSAQFSSVDSHELRFEGICKVCSKK
jgi:Fur family ferric uptake transcriptional regulator